MKKFLKVAEKLLLAGFIFCLCATILQVSGINTPFSKLNYADPVYNKKEEFDPTLLRINSMEKLERYCDSLYLISENKSTLEQYEWDYTQLVSTVIRRRFFHGYSHYKVSQNYLSVLFSRLTVEGFNAIVVPDDIMKYPFAACSQQSIVMMELLDKKGFETRKVSFSGKISGHFSFEVYYHGSWHFYDTNMEPDPNVLEVHDRPGIAYLVSHPDVLTQAYRQYPKEEILDIFPTYTYGSINKFPAPRGILFQRATKFLSYTLWFVLLIAYFYARHLSARIIEIAYVRNRRIRFPKPEATRSAAYYPGVTTPGA